MILRGQFETQRRFDSLKRNLLFCLSHSLHHSPAASDIDMCLEKKRKKSSDQLLCPPPPAHRITQQLFLFTLSVEVTSSNASDGARSGATPSTRIGFLWQEEIRGKDAKQSCILSWNPIPFLLCFSHQSQPSVPLLLLLLFALPCVPILLNRRNSSTNIHPICN